MKSTPKIKWYWAIYNRFFDKDFDTKLAKALAMKKIMDASTNPCFITHFHNEQGERIRGMVDGSKMKYSPDRSHPLYKHANGIPQNSHPLLEKYGH